MNFEFGDILINHCAGETNPCRRLVFIRATTKFIECICPYKNEKCEFYRSDHKLEKNGSILMFSLKELRERMVKVKLNQKGLEIYKESNGFWESNIDKEGYSTFSHDYLEKLFYPLQYKEFSHDVIIINREEK